MPVCTGRKKFHFKADDIIMPISRSFILDDSLPDEGDNAAQVHINSQYKVRVSSLSLTLNKAKYPLAKIKIAGLTSLVNMRENNISVKGKLMKINLTDMSPHGKMYREKLVQYSYCIQNY
jgi:vacuolar protein sorting-associated protein 13D